MYPMSKRAEKVIEALTEALDEPGKNFFESWKNAMLEMHLYDQKGRRTRKRAAKIRVRTRKRGWN